MLFYLELVQMDIKIAFLYGDLKKHISMTQLNNFKVVEKEHMISKLKSLYDLKQSLKQWYAKFDQFMTKKSYTKSYFDYFV